MIDTGSLIEREREHVSPIELPPLVLPLGVVFLAYLSLIFVFAWVYHRVFLRTPEAYSFASAILGTQSETFRKRGEAALAAGAVVREMLSRLASELAARPDLDLPPLKAGLSGVGHTESELGGVRIKLERRVLASPTAGLMGILHTLRLTTGGESYSRTFTESPSADTSLHRLVPLWLSTVHAELESWTQRLDTIASAAPEVWGFVDFFYFSVITQTTVGYGDILPNSSRVRLLVSLQILLGYALLVVIINLVITASTT